MSVVGLAVAAGVVSAGLLIASDRANSDLGGKLEDAVEFQAVLGQLSGQQTKVVTTLEHDSSAPTLERQLSQRNRLLAELERIAQRRSASTADRIAELRSPSLDERERWAAILMLERDHRFAMSFVGSRLQREAEKRTVIALGGFGSLVFGLVFAILAPIRRRGV